MATVRVSTEAKMGKEQHGKLMYAMFMVALKEKQERDSK